MPNGFHRCSTSELTSWWQQSRTCFGIRLWHSRAHRTDVGTRTAENLPNNATYYRRFSSAIREGVIRLLSVNPISRSARAEASRRSAHALVAAVPLPRPPARPDASGRKKTPGNRSQKRISMHAHPLQTPKTKRPRIGNPRAFALASGDRVTDLHDGIGRLENVFLRAMPYLPRTRHRIALKARQRSNVDEAMQHDHSYKVIANSGEGREHYASNIIVASAFLIPRNNSYTIQPRHFY